MKFLELVVMLVGATAIGLAIAALMGANLDLVDMAESIAGWFDFIEGWGD